MVRFVIIFFGFMVLGCEMNSKQTIKTENFTYEAVKFNTVSKKLLNQYKMNSPDHEILSEIIQYWFDNRIKTDGFDGNLSVNVKKMQFDREKKQDYYKFSISLSLEFLEI